MPGMERPSWIAEHDRQFGRLHRPPERPRCRRFLSVLLRVQPQPIGRRQTKRPGKQLSSRVGFHRGRQSSPRFEHGAERASKHGSAEDRERKFKLRRYRALRLANADRPGLFDCYTILLGFCEYSSYRPSALGRPARPGSRHLYGREPRCRLGGTAQGALPLYGQGASYRSDRRPGIGQEHAGRS